MTGLRFLVTSDVHLGAPRALHAAFTEMLLYEGPGMDLILINGDLVHAHTVRAQELLQGWIARMEQADVLHKIVVVLGNHDEPWLQKHPELTTADYATPTTGAHRYICLHGHHLGLEFLAEIPGWGPQFGGQVKDRLLEWATENKWPPQMTENDRLIVGHCHTQFYHQERQVISTGPWHAVKGCNAGIMGYVRIENKGKSDDIRLLQWNAHEKRKGDR